MTLAAEAPDLDVLGNFKGAVFGFAHHRGFTHSFLGLFLVSAVVVGFMYVVWRLRGRKIKDPNLIREVDLATAAMNIEAEDTAYPCVHWCSGMKK